MTEADRLNEAQVAACEELRAVNERRQYAKDLTAEEVEDEIDKMSAGEVEALIVDQEREALPDPLDGAEVDDREDGGETYTISHPAGPIVLRIMHDDHCHSPLDPKASDGNPALAMIEYSHERDGYIGTADPVDADLEIDCPECEGLGQLPHETSSYACGGCDGDGNIEADNVAQYLAVKRGAVASLEITVGGRDQAPAVLYYTLKALEEAGITDADAVLRDSADEYRKWEEGDCWGYSVTGPAIEDSCWGFIGLEYAMEEARSAVRWAIEQTDKEHAEAAYWADRDVETVSA